ncbi:MAG: hypothetical protein PVF54_07745, partial [Anaerolineae bacterium]
MLLNDRARIILFWLTIALMLVVAILAAATILRACGGLPTEREPAPAITPPEVSLCPGDEQRFAVGGDDEVDWDATGGSIGQAGVFTAGDSPGDYTVTATRDDSGQAAGAIVHIIACTPTPTATPFPTALPTITPTAPPAPTTTPSDSPDPGGDIGAYETGAPVDPQPSGVDIRAASISPDLSVGFQTTQDSPAELSDW